MQSSSESINLVGGEAHLKSHSKSKLFTTLLLSFILVSGAVLPNQGLVLAQGIDTPEKLRKTKWAHNGNIAEPIIEVPEGLPVETKPVPIGPRKMSKADSIVVKYKDGMKPISLAATYDLESVHTLPGLGAELIKLPEGSDADSILLRLKSDPSVLFAEPNGLVFTPDPAISGESVTTSVYFSPPFYSPHPVTTDVYSSPPFASSHPVTSDVYYSSPFVSPYLTSQGAELENFIPNDPLFPEQWGLHNTGSSNEDPEGLADIDINAPEAWSIMKKDSKELVVAVISDGVDINHPDLVENIWTNPKEIAGNGIDDDGNGFVDDVHGWDFYNDDNNTNDLIDPPNNGTAVAGTIAASMNNAIGIAGIAPNVKILPIKSLSWTTRSGYANQIAEGIAYAERMGADIVVLDFFYYEPSDLILDTLKATNMLIVAPTDNQGNDMDIYPVYPASYSLPNLLTVLGMLRSGSIITSYGKKSVNIAAPAAFQVITTVPSDNPAYAAQIDTGVYKAIFNGIGFENFSPPFQMDSARIALDYLAEGFDKPSVLLVQDDNSIGGKEWEQSHLEQYMSFLLSAGYEANNIQIVSVPKNESGPSLASMKPYDIVVWFTGDADPQISPEPNDLSMLTELDKANLTDYLNSGGRLLLTGRNALFGNETSSFVTDMLHLDYLSGSFVGFYELLGGLGTIYDGQSTPMPEVYNGDVIAARDSFARTNLLLNKPDYDYHSFFSSAAIAHAAGVAALVLGANPKYDAKMVIQRLMNSGKKVSSLLNKNISGKMLDAYRALSDKDIPGTPLQVPEVSERLDEAVDPDRVYAIELNAGETIQATLSGEEGTDFDLYLFDPSTTSVNGKAGIVAASEHPGTSNEELSYLVKKTGTYYLNVYAFAGSGSYKLRLQHGNTSGIYEENSNAVTLVGEWGSVTDSKLSGGSSKRLDAQGYVEFTFEGSYVEWIGTKNVEQGIANVYLDGKLDTPVSLYSETELKQQVLFKKDVLYDKHTIKIEWTGKTDPKARKSAPAFVNVDAFVVKHLIQDSDISQVFFDGTWARSFSSLYSGHSIQTSYAKDSYSEITFVGTKVRLLARVGGNSGIADIYIDGQFVESVDFYRKTRQYEAVIFQSEPLSDGKHTIRVVNKSEKHIDSTGTAISIDAFEID
jgi:subtilisin family serine protease